MKKPPKFCDEYIHDLDAPGCLRFFLLVNRMPAADQMLMRRFGVKPSLYADYKGKRVRVTMASRLGDVGITEKLNAEDGYDIRVLVAALKNFSQSPDRS